METGFYGDYYYSLLEHNDLELVNQCVDHWATRYTENVLAGRNDMFSSGMLLAATTAAYELIQGDRVKAMRDYMLEKAGREND